MPRSLDRTLTMAGETLSLAEWAKRYRIRPVIVRGRLRRGWDVADAVTSPEHGVPIRVVRP